MKAHVIKQRGGFFVVFFSIGEQCNGGPGLERDWDHRPKPQKEDPACCALVTQGDKLLITTSVLISAQYDLIQCLALHLRLDHKDANFPLIPRQ